MWYEIIPTALLASLVGMAPQTIVYYVNQYFLGNPMRRNLSLTWDRNMFTRDCRIDGAPWRNSGLDNIPDD
ncbi:hypothetical protein HN011_007322 [Eciton burchellii]|nr:hypothetical protein HN011_007322 [Eciton burchellii]